MKLHTTDSDFVFKNQEGNPINEDKWRAKYWYRALRACGIRPWKFCATRHTFISQALTNRVNIKWLAEYCGTSVAMIEKHYGRYLKNDSDEQLRRTFHGRAGTFTGTLGQELADEVDEVVENESGIEWSGRVDLNDADKKTKQSK